MTRTWECCSYQWYSPNRRILIRCRVARAKGTPPSRRWCLPPRWHRRTLDTDKLGTRRGHWPRPEEGTGFCASSSPMKEGGGLKERTWSVVGRGPSGACRGALQKYLNVKICKKLEFVMRRYKNMGMIQGRKMYKKNCDACHEKLQNYVEVKMCKKNWPLSWDATEICKKKLWRLSRAVIKWC